MSQNTAMEKREEKPIDIVRRDLTKMESQFEKALPTHVTPERFVRIAMTAISTNQSLQNCDRNLLYAELMKCAQDGLLPDGREAAIVIYGNVPRYMPMVGGICKKARNSGEIKTINAHCVYSNDEFDSWTDNKGDQFKFRKARGDRGTPVLTFAFAITKDDGFFFEEISEEQMADIERCSKANKGPWKGDFRDEMKRKSAIRRLAKYRLPSSTDLDEIIRRDDDMYDLNPPHISPASSQKALASHLADRDYLPGIKPPQNAAQFCENLKEVPGGPEIIWNTLEEYRNIGNTEAASKLSAAASNAGVPPLVSDQNLSGNISNDEKFPFEKEEKNV